MSFYEVDFSYKVEEFGTVSVEADDTEQAEAFAREYVYETYPDTLDVTIDDIKAINR